MTDLNDDTEFKVFDAPLDRPRDDGEDRTNLIINYLPQSMTDNEMYSMFITCGPLASAKIMRDKSSGYSFGYGFVQYKSPEDAAKAITQLNGLPVSNKRIKVSYSRPNTADIKNTNLYIGNVPADISEEDLMNLFTPYGSILTKNVLKDQTGRNKGIAFVRFSKKCEADLAISKLNRYLIPGSSQPLDVKVAEDHGKQKAAFYAGINFGQQEALLDGDPGTYAWGLGRGGGRGRGGRGGGPPSIAASMAAQGFGYGFNAVQQPPAAAAAARGGNRFNPISRGAQKGGGGGYNNNVPRGGASWGAASFTRGGGRGGFGDDSVAWN